MANFKSAIDSIEKGIADLSSLEVVTYKGRITLTANEDLDSFDAILKNARANAEFRILACTKSELDGDTRVFYDQDATPAEIAAHNQVVDSAAAKRAAVVQMFESAITAAIK